MTPSNYRLLASRSFQKTHPVAKEPSFIDYTRSELRVMTIALMEFRKAVWVLAKCKKKSLEDKLRHRRWLINQAKKWGISSTVIHDSLANYGGNFLGSTH